MTLPIELETSVTQLRAKHTALIDAVNAYRDGTIDASKQDLLTLADDIDKQLTVEEHTLLGQIARKAKLHPRILQDLRESPLRLFMNGEQGVWYDPSDLSTLFQDAAGAVPVAATGDPVGMMLDKSGNGLHAIQGTAAGRPVYNSAAGVSAQVFDGTDDVLRNSTVNSVMTEFSLFIACTYTGADAVTRTVFKAGNRGLSGGDDIILLRTGGTSGVTGGEPGLSALTPITLPLGTPTVMEIHFANTSVEWVKDGVTIATTAIPDNAGVKVTNDITIGAATTTYDGSSAQHWTGSHYGTVLVGRTLSEMERQATRKYLAAKAGVTL